MNMHCWFCFERSKGESKPIAGESNVFMFKAGKAVHLTTLDESLPKNVYLRIHPDSSNHNVKPFRMHCMVCGNQLGALVIADNSVFPSLQQNSVIFVDDKNNTLNTIDWKNKYAKRTPQVAIKKNGNHKKQKQKLYLGSYNLEAR